MNIRLAMPTFLWSGKRASGRQDAEEVEAESPAEARKILEARGWTELRQHTTEVNDFVRRQIRESQPTRSEDHPKLTPMEALQIREGTAPGLWSNWLKSIRKSAKTILWLASFLVLILIKGRGTTTDRGIFIGIFAALLVITIFLFPALHWWFGRTKRWFVKLHTARNWRRWEEVLRCIDKLSNSQQATKIGIGDFEMARYRALALAGLGRLDEAIKGYHAAAEKAKPPQWLFHSQEGSIYTVARQYDRALECHRLAFETAADNSTACLDLGMYLVKHFNRPDEARQLLATAEKAQLSELQRNYLPYLRGLIAFRENDFVTMDKNIREALAGFEKRAAAKFYIFEPSLLTCKGYLAVSSAALGRFEEAKQYFAQAQRYLTVVELNDILTQYQVLTQHKKSAAITDLTRS